MKRIVSALLLLAPFLVEAHPGHGSFRGIDPMHYLTSPLHLVSLAVIVGAGIWLYVRKSKKQKA